MNEEIENENQSSESNFEQIFQQRISQIEEKVSKYCLQYDALMNLLPIGSHFSSVLNLQKDIDNAQIKIDLLNLKINSVNNQDVIIDTNKWQKDISNFKSLYSENKKELQKLQKVQKERNIQLNEDSFQQKISQKVSFYEEIITKKLAKYKNKIEQERHKNVKSNYRQVYQSIKKRIQNYMRPYDKKLNDMLKQIEVCRLKVPLRNLKDFHDFNYKRLLEDIFRLNQTLQGFFESLNHQKVNNCKIELSTIQIISQQINSIRYQAIGNKQKCLNDILLGFTLQQNSQDSYQKIESHIHYRFEQLTQSLNELQEKLQLLHQYIIGT